MSGLKISSPVGRTTGNKPHEVMAVQKALNYHLKSKIGYVAVKENGLISQETLEAIYIFQAMSGICPADSVIFPNSITHRNLNKNAVRVANPLAARMSTDRSDVRQAIINRLGVIERKQWNAINPAKLPGNDWDYKAIAIHHAGNSFTCGAAGIDSLRQVEKIDMSKFGQVSYHYAIDCAGTIYEALDIRDKGAHVAKSNTGIIGLVFLADFSARGEAGKYGPGIFNVAKKEGLKSAGSEFLSVQKDRLDVSRDEPPEVQLTSAEKLVRTLAEFFPIKKLGGHREFAVAIGTSRACPGIYGMIIAEQLRNKFGFERP